MPNTPVQPTKIKVASGSGTPGAFAGKNYRPSAPTKAQQKAATQEIANKMAQIRELEVSTETQKAGLEQINIVTADAQKQVEKLKKDIETLKLQGGDVKSAEKTLVQPIKPSEINKALPGPM